MSTNTNKIKLSPRLRWGVGRDMHNFNPYKIAGAFFLILSAVLIFRAGFVLISGEEEQDSNPQVLGASDTSTPKAVFSEYKVKKGDTLFTISKDNNVEWTTIATINELKAPFSLQVGQTIKIPQD